MSKVKRTFVKDEWNRSRSHHGVYPCKYCQSFDSFNKL